MSAEGPRLSTWESFKAVARSWRLLSVALLSFSSGLPLGLVWLAIPTWMTQEGLDIRLVGLFQLAQLPWSFKFLWSPLMDRFPIPILGRKRGWILSSQAVLLGLGAWLASVSDRPPRVWIIGFLALATALASATQDIVIDAYTVEVLRKEEQGMAVGARVALYRAAMLLSGGWAITYAARVSWAWANLGIALLYAPLMLVTCFAPQPEAVPEPPKTLREAVWGPFVGFLGQHRAFEIIAFVTLYKLSDNLAQGLIRPFLVQAGFSADDVGVGTAVVSTAALLGGTFLGGLFTGRIGLGRALWVFGIIQTVAHLGYAAVAQVGVHRPLMYGAFTLEYGTSGLANGAFGVLLLRLTQKRFSATQYALLSSAFSVPRVLAGPVAGVIADSIGWRDFFVLTVFTGIPGLVMLQRFVPWSVREPVFHVPAALARQPLKKNALLGRALTGGVLAWAAGLVTMAALAALKRLQPGSGFRFREQMGLLLAPRRLEEWITSAGVAAFALIAALATAATLAARGAMEAARGAAEVAPERAGASGAGAEPAGRQRGE